MCAGEFPDEEIFKIGLMNELQPGERVEVNSGYTGDLPIRPKSNFGGKEEWMHMNGGPEQGMKLSIDFSSSLVCLDRSSDRTGIIMVTSSKL